MDEAKAAAYYDELTRKGGGAAKFKQGLGFSSSSASPSPHPSSLSSSFVRASSPTAAAKQARLDSVHNKLTAPDRCRDGDRERDRDRRGERYRDEEERRHRRSRRSRSRSRSPRGVRDRDRDRGHVREKDRVERRGVRKKIADVDYDRLIEGYSEMTPAERVKAKMKFQLSQTAAKDTAMGMSTGWERFDFNKDAPLDGDEEIEVAEDDASVVKVIGKSFRSSAAEAKREEDLKAAHDQAMFGAPIGSLDLEPNQETDALDLGEENPKEVLISKEVFAVQQGSWRDRVRRFQKSSEK